MTEDVVEMQLTEDTVEMSLVETSVEFTLVEKTAVILLAMFGFNEEDTYGFDDGSYGFYVGEMRQ